VGKVVGVILAQNEARHITASIQALRPWVDAVIVLDGGSDDATQRLARQAGAWVVTRPFDHFAAQRQAALDMLDAEWVFFVDADERVTAALGAEVQRLVQAGAADGYWVPRRNFIVGHEMRHGGYFPDYQLRLLRRAAAHYDVRREVHEFATVDGPLGHMREPLIHYNYLDWPQFHRKQRAYAAYEARMLAARGIRPRPHHFVLQPMREFWRRFVTLAGWRDGWPGLQLAIKLAWYYGFIPYGRLWRPRAR
jgi:glycosyltransferase involved in cell wall biosynthesis